MKGISLRYKLLAALTVIPLVALSIFLFFAISIFQKDKIAYVFDASLSVSKTRAAQVASELSSLANISQAIVLSYRADSKDLSETGNYYFDHDDKMAVLQIYALNPSTGQYEKTVDLNKDGAQEELAPLTPDIPAFVKRSAEMHVAIHGASGASSSKVLFGARFGEVSDPKHLVALVLYEAGSLAQVFQQGGPYKGFLLTKTDGRPLFAAATPEAKWTPQIIWSELEKRKTPEGIAELQSPSQKTFLASFSDVGVADLVVVSLVDQHSALAAVDLLLRKSKLFFLVILSTLAIIAVLASRGLTGALSRLTLATRKISQGDFGVRVDTKSGGEIGQLASGFNAMATEVSRLMKETAEKARMESELATAKTVQETLFPEANAVLGPVEISGHYMPASECGGDWWYYCENDGKIYIWIGDATGHGAPAALLTSAARAVVSVLLCGPARTVSESLGILNQAICDTSKGTMMMTFFLACIEKETGVMTYSNASHESPFLLHEMETEPTRDDFIHLNSVNNPRLGEQRAHVFKEATLTLKEGDSLVFYTDGVVDIKNPEHKNWGERRFMKSLSAELYGGSETPMALNGVAHSLHTFRSEVPLDDDVTLIICRYRAQKHKAAA